jgi:hypothetical protein
MRNWWAGLTQAGRLIVLGGVALVVALAVIVPVVVHSGNSCSGGGSGRCAGDGGVVTGPVSGNGPGSDAGPGSTDGSAGTGTETGTETGTIQPVDAAAGESHLDQLLSILTDTTGAAGAVNTLWDAEFPQISGGQSWTPLSIQTYTDGESACGMPADQVEHNSFYCPSDDVIWADTTWLNQLLDQYGDFAPVIILLHENGHRVATLSGRNGAVSIQREEEADCIAGYETQYAAAAGLVKSSDVQEGMNTLYNIGDTNGSPWFNPDVHGNPAQREAAFLQGFSGNLNNCFAISQAAFGPVATVGSFNVDLVTNVQSQAFQDGDGLRLTFPGSSATTDLTPYEESSTLLTGDATADAQNVAQSYFAGCNADDTGDVDSFVQSQPDGSTQTTPLSSLVSAADGDTVTGFNYTQSGCSNSSDTFYGLWVLVERPGAGALVIDTYTTGTNDPQSFLSESLQVLSGLGAAS